MWRVWIDTGGTFTDGLGLDPGGGLHRAKVLSSSALRGRVENVLGSRELHYRSTWRLVDGFAAGAELRWLDREAEAGRIVRCRGAARRLEIDAEMAEDLEPGEAFEIGFDDEAPTLTARLLTATPAGAPLPPMALRLATTRGTNALLERRGARCVLFVTRGFGDLLRIGNQQRPDLFALDVRRPPPLYREVAEVDERLDASGEVIEALDLPGLAPRLAELAEQGFDSAAAAFLHSYRPPSRGGRPAA